MSDHTTAARVTSDTTWTRLRAEIASGDTRPLLLYVHVPFCSYKCGFCDWVKEIPANRLRATGDIRSRYVGATAAQIRHHGPRLTDAGFTPCLVYWGGGTPTRLDPDEIAALGQALHDACDWRAIEEFTVECSPETATIDKLRALAAQGATRLSLGAQSFDDDELRRAGRGHSADQVREAIAAARTAGFEDLNIDLIAAFPGQTLEALRDSVQQTIALDPAHITVYVYRATDGTAMAEQLRRGKRPSNDYRHMLESYQSSREMLEAAGYHEYAIGYFARDVQRPCRADQYYFAIEGDYFGFGGGAHSIVAHHFLENAAAEQDVFASDPNGFSYADRFSIDNLSKLFASLSQTLWIPEGVRFDRFQDRYGLPFDTVAAHPYVRSFMAYYESCGAVFERTDTHLRVSRETLVPAYIRALSLYGTQNEGRAVASARTHTA